MKHLLATLLLFVVPSVESAADDLKGSLVGIWWGSLKVTKGASSGRAESHRWLIERKDNGRFRIQRFLVDPGKKLYCSQSAEPDEGTWRLAGSLLTHQLDNGNTGSDVVSVVGGEVKWNGGSMSGPQVLFDCKEVKIERFEPVLGEDYRRVTREDFAARYKRGGEQGAEMKREERRH